jgi:tetratricopeptide (TPR) repeat protein/ABC-type cobalamin/Fe3+-siderophores transport system ATPase subunit
VPSNEPAILRALEGLAERSGRTLVVVGPPGSGKSALLAELSAGVESTGGRSLVLRGTYRDRAVPFGALEGLDRPADAPADETEDGEPPATDVASIAPMAPVALAPESLGGSRRREGRARSLAFGGPSRARGPPARNVDDYWMQLLPEFQGDDAHPVALLLDDAVFFDGDSRQFVIDLSRRARLRPLLLAVALDSTSSAAAVWEEALIGRADVDWVRRTRPAEDPREVHRLRELLDDLPPPATRALGYVTLLGGETTEVILARIARLSLPQLREATRPALELGLLRVRDGKVSVPDRSSLPILEGLFPDAERARWHFDVAEGLQALSAEPPLSRRIEIARHYLASAPDGVAMARLLEAAEISLGLLEFDEAARLLADAMRCLPSVPPGERTTLEPEMHLLNARALYAAGCPAEAETALREGVEGALRVGASATDLASWIEPLLPALQVVGPRRQLATTVVELAERLHAVGLVEPEVLLETLLPAYDVERNLPDRAQADALRAAQNAHRMRERHLQALGLFAMGVSRVLGGPADAPRAERFLRAARYLLRDSRRWELDYLAAEFECRLSEARGMIDQSLAVRQQNVVALERARLPSVELLHDLGIAQILLDRDPPSRADAPLDRALRLVDTLHLLPPSPGLLRAWLLEGRRYAVSGSINAARERWLALADLPPTLSLPQVRAEAILRLALLEQAAGRTEEVERLTAALATPEVAAALPQVWKTWPSELASRAASSQHGGGPLPIPAPARAPSPKPTGTPRGTGRRRP